MKKIVMIMLGAMLAMPTIINAQNMNKVTTSNVIEMVSAGMGTEVIKGLIEQSTDRDLKLEMNDLLELKNAGAEDELLTYLQNLNKKDHGLHGIYWWNTTDGKPVKIEQASVDKEKKGGFGSMLGSALSIGSSLLGAHTGNLGMIFDGSAIGNLVASGDLQTEKMIIKEPHAKAQITGENKYNPVFRFCLEKVQVAGDDPVAWFANWMNSIESPNEFQCIKLKANKKKRNFPGKMKWSVLGFSSEKDGGKEVIPFEVKAINNTTSEVTFPNGLEPGEYCFFFKDLKNPIFKDHVCAFDFSIIDENAKAKKK